MKDRKFIDRVSENLKDNRTVDQILYDIEECYLMCNVLISRLRKTQSNQTRPDIPDEIRYVVERKVINIIELCGIDLNRPMVSLDSMRSKIRDEVKSSVHQEYQQALEDSNKLILNLRSKINELTLLTESSDDSFNHKEDFDFPVSFSSFKKVVMGTIILLGLVVLIWHQ